jgi:hypothetical protein
MMGDMSWFLSVAAVVSASAVTGCIAETAPPPPQPETAPPPPQPEPAHSWEWVPKSDMFCRDGSTTGYGVNKPDVESDKLLYLMMGGGACFNLATCALNPYFFGKAEFVEYSNGSGIEGVMARDNPLNPFKDWNYVFVPYCTGDAHGGDNPDGSIRGTPMMFVGHNNMAIVIDEVKSRFPDITSGVLSGVSAGGLGTLVNYTQLHDAYADNPIPWGLLDDSGPPMNTVGVRPCLQELMWDLWGLEKTIECPTCKPDDFLLPISIQSVGLAIDSGAEAGYIDSTQDLVMREFFGFGLDNCDPPIPLPMPGIEYEGALFLSLMDIAEAHDEFQYFVFAGDNHTSIQTDLFYDTTGSEGPPKVDARVSGPDDTGLPTWTAEYLLGTGGRLWPPL